MADGVVLIVGGTGGLGREVARHYQAQGEPVIITGRDPERSAEVAHEIGSGVTGLAFEPRRASHDRPGARKASGRCPALC